MPPFEEIAPFQDIAAFGALVVGLGLGLVIHRALSNYFRKREHSEK